MAEYRLTDTNLNRVAYLTGGTVGTDDNGEPCVTIYGRDRTRVAHIGDLIVETVPGRVGAVDIIPADPT